MDAQTTSILKMQLSFEFEQKKAGIGLTIAIFCSTCRYANVELFHEEFPGEQFLVGIPEREQSRVPGY